MCPAPHGAGGLKCPAPCRAYPAVQSRPAWGGWIEIGVYGINGGLVESRPAWGGWIEIAPTAYIECEFHESRPAWGGWIEISLSAMFCTTAASRPAWGGWIEIIGWPGYKDKNGGPAPHGAGGLK